MQKGWGIHLGLLQPPQHVPCSPICCEMQVWSLACRITPTALDWLVGGFSLETDDPDMLLCSGMPAMQWCLTGYAGVDSWDDLSQTDVAVIADYS